MKDFEVIRYIENHGHIDDAVKDISIKAIKELHEYRKIGTVEDCRKHKDGCIIAKVTFDKNQMQEIVDEKIKEFEVDIQATRNKAIDEFAEALKNKAKEIMKNPDIMLDCKICNIWKSRDIDEIAEKLKGGV